ncbi:histone-like nucleoid-structuring protein Lsr2 [Streptomyces sp. NPDC054775]
MGQKTILTDDLTGAEAEETVTFALDGKAYEIDLSTKNADKLREALADFVKAGRRTGGKRSRARKLSGRSQDTAAIRSWARENGYEVSERGRVSATIREAYAKANG